MKTESDTMKLHQLIRQGEDWLTVDRHFRLAVGVLAVLFVLLRCYHINAPILDRHSWNQVSAAAIAMNIYQDPSTFWAPDSNAFVGDTEDATLGQEFPVFMGLVALAYGLIAPEVWVARLVAIAIAFIGWVYLLKLLLLSEDRFTALFILFLYTINSHNWFFDRAINSDTGMVSFMLASLYYFWKFLKDPNFRHMVALFITTLLAGLFKPYGLQIGISFLYLMIVERQLKRLLDVRLILIGVLVWSINMAWLLHTRFNLPHSIGLGHDLGFNPGDLFSLEFLNVMIQRFFDQITTQFLMFFCIFAIFSRKVRNRFAMALLVANLFYLVLITHGNIVHNYYQLPMTPALIIFSGLGFLYWVRLPAKRLSPKLKTGLIIFLLMGYVAYSGKKTWNHFRLAMGPKQLGDRIMAMDLQPDTRLISLESSTTRYHETLYYAEKKGWVRRKITVDELDKLRGKGAEYVVVHLEEGHFDNEAEMAPLYQKLEPVWVSYDCTNTYGDPCMIGIFRFKDE